MKSHIRFRADCLAQARDFRQACCDYFNCRPSEYEQVLLLHCMHPHAVATANLILRVLPFYFDWDTHLLRAVAGATDLNEFKEELSIYLYLFPLTGPLHRRLRIRISRHRLLSLAKQLFDREATQPIDERKMVWLHLQGAGNRGECLGGLNLATATRQLGLA